jgi:capsular polysaccharide transport system permease protein
MRIALATQLRVIGALILRETRTRFGRSQLGYLWAIAEPLAYVVFLSLVFVAVGRHAPFGDDVALFFATGILPFMLFNKLTGALGAAFNANEALLTYPIVKPIDTLLARAALEIATAAMVMILMFAGLMYAHGVAAPARIDILAAAILGLSLLGFGLGATNAVIARLFPSWREIYGVISRPLIIVCAVFFPLESLPAAARDAVAMIPMAHGVELFRTGYFDGYRSSALSVEYLFVAGLVLTLVGLAGERALRVRPA